VSELGSTLGILEGAVFLSVLTDFWTERVSNKDHPKSKDEAVEEEKKG
jgi:hypothetical protein